MRICMVFDDDYPWDVRVERIGRALTGGGHEVFLACRNRKRTDVLAETVHTLQVRRMAPYRALPAAVDRQLMFPAFFSPRWLGHIKRVIRENSCDAVLVRDLPLAMAGVNAGQQLGLPVAIDMAENYPAALRAFQMHDGRRLLDLVVRNPRAADRLERSVARRADHIMVVCDEMRGKIIGLRADPGRVTVVGNTPDLERFGAVSPPEEVTSRYADRFVLLYVGEVNPYRGLGTAVDALPAIREKIPNVTLAVIGRGSGIDDLARRAKELGVTGHLDLVGFLPHEELAGFIARSEVCLIPHLRTEHIDTTLPNKLFEYMALGRPVLPTDAVPLERVVTETGCGATYRSGDPADMARAVLDLADPGRREEMGSRGHEAVRGRYNWAQDTEILLGVFRSEPMTRRAAQNTRMNIT